MFKAMWQRMTQASEALRATTDIGNILMKMGVVDERTLEEAVRRQVEQEKKSRIGEILIDMGVLTRDQLDNALHAQKLMRKGRKADAMVAMVERRTEALHKAIHGVTHA